MGRHDDDDGDVSNIMVVGSSIALLQERFRQLERVREKRAAREKISPTCNSKVGFERKSSVSSFSSSPSLGMVMNTSPRIQRKVPVAYGNELNHDEDVKRRQRLTNWWPDYDASTAMANFSTTSSDQMAEVDTSLHL